MSKTFIAVIIMLLAAVCSSKRNIEGFYKSDKNANTYIFLKLKHDLSFDYGYQFVDFVEHSSGSYKVLDSHHVLLNSNIQFTKIPLSVTEIKTDIADTCNKITVNLKVKNGGDLSGYYCTFLVNNKIYFFNKKQFSYSKPCDSLNSVIIQGPIKTIAFSISKYNKWSTNILSGLRTTDYEVKTLMGNHLSCTINCNDAYFGYKVFDNTICRLRKNSIRFNKGLYIKKVKSPIN